MQNLYVLYVISECYLVRILSLYLERGIDEKLFPVCYASKTLSSAKGTILQLRRKECLAVVWGQEISPLFVRSFRYFADGARTLKAYEQCKVCERTSYALGYVFTKLYIQS